MKNFKELFQDILDNGELRKTRTGDVYSVWNRTLEFDMSEGFPVPTSKKFFQRACFGELLFFISGKSSIQDLKHYTFGDPTVDKWTIWTDDAKRWHGVNDTSDVMVSEYNELGRHYGVQWRNYGGNLVYSPVDQIENLVYRLINQPERRDHIVMAWNPVDIEGDNMCLKPCHLGFQCYVTKSGKLNLHWFQRSVDSFLGLQFNCASYGLLLHMLAEWTGYEAGNLSCWLGDTHIYANHVEQVKRYISNKEYPLPGLVLPEKAKSMNMLYDLKTFDITALDFEGCLQGYQYDEVIKAPLSTGS